jgi:hypothetical protein
MQKAEIDNKFDEKIVEDIYDTHEKIDQILETLEVLMDEETLKRVR